MISLCIVASVSSSRRSYLPSVFHGLCLVEERIRENSQILKFLCRRRVGHVPASGLAYRSGLSRIWCHTGTSVLARTLRTRDRGFGGYESDRYVLSAMTDRIACRSSVCPPKWTEGMENQKCNGLQLRAYQKVRRAPHMCRGNASRPPFPAYLHSIRSASDLILSSSNVPQALASTCIQFNVVRQPGFCSR